MKRLHWLVVSLLFVASAQAQIISGPPLSNPVTTAQGGLGADFSASTGIFYDAAGTVSALACTASTTVLVGGAPPACTATPTGLTSLSAGTLTATTSATIGGATPTAITNIRVYTPTLTPTQIAAAIGFVEQAFTVTGLTTADTVTVNAPAAPTALCAMTAWWVSAADTLSIQYFNAAVALCTPAAGAHRIVAIRS